MDDVVNLATRAASSAALAETLQSLDPERHAALEELWRRHHRDLRRRLVDVGALSRLAMVAATLDDEPELLLTELDGKVLRSLIHDDAALDHVAVACARRDREWCERLLDLAARDDAVASQLWSVTSRIATAAGLPQPSGLGAWLGRFRPPRSGKGRALFQHIVADLAGLTPSERRSAVAALKRALTGRAYERWREPLDGWAVPLMLEIGGTPAQVVHTMGATWWGRLEARDHVLQQLLTRDGAFVRDVVDAALAMPRVAAQVEVLLPLLDSLDLPVPDNPAYLAAWLERHGDPRPGIRWQEHLLAACRVPDTVALLPEPQEHMRPNLLRLRTAEPLAEDAVALALLGVWEQGARQAAQRRAWQWLTELDLVDALRAHPGRVVDVIAHAEGSVAKHLVAWLLAEPLDDDRLTALSHSVLARPEKGLRRQVLGLLDRIASPTAELVATVTPLTTDSDATTAGLATALLARWDQAPAPVEQLGLWREPTLTPPKALAEFDPAHLVVDPPTWLELAATARHPFGSAVDKERALAALVATAHTRGLDGMAEYVTDTTGVSLRVALIRQFGMWEAAKRARTDRLDGLLHRRTGDLGLRLGEIPCVLSAPSHTVLGLSWQALAARVEAYRRSGQAALASDVAVALGRLDRDRIPDDLSPFLLPIDGCQATLDEVLAAWRDHPPTPLAVTLLPPPSRPLSGWGTATRATLEISGDEPGGFDLLGIVSPWNAQFRPNEYTAVWERALLPRFASRGAAALLRELEGVDAPPVAAQFAALAEAATPFDPLTTFTALVFANDVAAKEREPLATALLDAWDDGRLRAEDLATAWASPWRRGWPISAAKLTTLCRMVAEAAGLALVWPLLTRMAEELAAESPVPASASATLEAVLALLPEVPGPVRLPAVAALAARKGSSKAVRVARQIVAAT
ncbi:hypothetical protein [Arachnia propionica]|uniref:hypothetical protein n=1 Tax=Arachnia propionica TaxID=1750 RepID=UPI00163B58E2|nr:hypothetical protein [Arachnia propionica]